MSVLSNNTHITFNNDTNHFLEVTFSGEQNSNLTVFHKHSQIISNKSVFDYLYSLIAGEESKLVHVNIPLKSKTTLTIKCNANLYFNITPKISKAENTEDGTFVLNTDYQNNNLELKFTESHGVGYDENGDVCINFMKPVKRDLVIKTSILLDGNKLNINCGEAFCKIQV